MAETEKEPEVKEPEPLTHCPACGRKLLTSLSALCNWCGAPISDPEYQKRAAEERAALDKAERERVDQAMSETATLGVIGRLKQVGRKPQRPIPPPEAGKYGPD